MCKSLFFLLLLCPLAWAQTIPKAGQVYESVKVDLDGDGRTETVALAAYNVDSEVESFFGRLRVLDSAGKLLWQAPSAASPEQPFAFGAWPYGTSNLEWIGDADGDGKVELLSPAPVSDLRPPTYRRYRWNGKAFQALSPKMLLEAPPGSGTFAWRDPIEWDGVTALTWAGTLSGAPSELLAEITSYHADGAVWGGKARMKGNGLGLTVTTWLQRLGPAR
jgi:hypothetical protein